MSRVMALLAELFDDSPEIRPDSPRIRPRQRAEIKTFSPNSPDSPPEGGKLPVPDQHEPASVPPCCHGCNALEIIPGVGAGCVRPLPGGPWREGWRRLPADLKRCGERQEAAPDRRTVRAKGTGCGRWRQRDIHGR